MRIVFLFIAIAISAAAAFFTYNMIKGDEQAQQSQAGLVVQPQVIEKQIPTQDVYVARGEIKVGDVIQQDMLDRQPWPKHLIGPGFVTAGNEAPKVIGMVARTPFAPGEVVLDSKLANPQDPSFIAASIPDGTRAVTIAVTPVSGVAGLIYPGDRVDVMLTHNLYSQETLESEKDKIMEEAMEALDSDDEDEVRRLKEKYGIVQQKRPDTDPVTEMIIPDVRVLAVNQRAVINAQDNNKKEQPQTITLEVLKEDAQRVKLGEKVGNISLALRSLHDKSAELPDPSAEGDLSRTIPPGYFPRIFGFGDPYPKELLAKAKKEVHKKTKDKVIVVRGVTVQELEFEIPGGRQ